LALKVKSWPFKTSGSTHPTKFHIQRQLNLQYHSCHNLKHRAIALFSRISQMAYERHPVLT
jgi:hypothetical protein